MKWARSLAGMGAVLVLAGSLAWAGDPIPMFGDYATTAIIFETQKPSPIAPTRGAFKAAENESPAPQDRLFLDYRFWGDLKVGAGTDAHRELIGVEKTFFGGDVSIGLRLPFFQVKGTSTVSSDSGIDDLSLILKYAPFKDLQSGSLLSTGLVVTVPSGDGGFIVNNHGKIEKGHPALFQPFVGYLWSRGDFYLHGFESLMVPTDSRDVTVLFTDIGLGYWLFRGDGDALLTGVIPTVEVHVNTPLNRRDLYRDAVDFTGGAHFRIKDRYLLGVAISTPVAGARLFDWEMIANFNFRF